MPDHEILGYRWLEYSCWHRTASIRRFINPIAARRLDALDVDFLEYSRRHPSIPDWTPLALIETARDFGQHGKPGQAMRALALPRTKAIPTIVLLYKWSTTLNPACPGHFDDFTKHKHKHFDIEYFRAQRLRPDGSFGAWHHFTPQEWAIYLCRLHHVDPDSGAWIG